MTASVPPRSEYRALPEGPAVAAVRLATVPLVEVRLRLPAPVSCPRTTAAVEAAAETLFGPTAPVTARLVAHGCHLVAVGDQDDLCVAATGPAVVLPVLLSAIGEALTRQPTSAEAAEAIRTLAVQSRTAEDDPEAVATRAVLSAAYGASSPYAHELPGPDLLEALRPEEVLEMCARVTTVGGSIVVVGDIDTGRVVEWVHRHLTGLGRPALDRETLPAVPTTPVNLALHRPGAAQTTLRRVLVAPPEALDSAAWRVCDLVFGGQPSARLARRLREENGYAYIARSRLVRRPRRTDLRVVAEVGSAVTGAALALLDDVTRRMPDGITDDERTAAGGFAAGALVMARAGQSDLAGALSQELALRRPFDALERDEATLPGVTRDELDRVAGELDTGTWHTVLVGDLDRIGRGTLPPLGGTAWTFD